MTKALPETAIRLPSIKDVLHDTTHVEGTSAYRNTEVNLEIDPTKPTIFLISGPSGSGKDSIVLALTDQETPLYCVIFIRTATNRKPREDRDDGEPETDEYTWMNDPDDYPHDGESKEDFEERMVKKYRLVESSIHNGILYGLPLTNLQAALATSLYTGESNIIRPDILGAETLKTTESIREIANVVSIFILRDTDKIAEVIFGTDGMAGRENPEIRLAKVYDELTQCGGITHFYIVNEEGTEGLNMAQESLYAIIQRCRAQEP